MTFAAVTGVNAKDPASYTSGLDIARGVFEAITVLVAVYSLLTELNQMRRSETIKAYSTLLYLM